MSKLMSVASPDKLNESLANRQICLSYSSPVKVVKIDAGPLAENEEHGVLSALFGMPKALADAVE